MENLFMAMKNMCAFVLLTTVINNLLGSDSYRKYIRLFSGLIIIIILINPLYELINMDIKFDEKIIEFAGESVDMGINSETVNEINKAGESVFGYAVTKYKEQVQTDIMKIVSEYDFEYLESEIDIKEDIDDKDYGQINKLLIDVRKQSHGKSRAKELTVRLASEFKIRETDIGIYIKE